MHQHDSSSCRFLRFPSGCLHNDHQLWDGSQKPGQPAGWDPRMAPMHWQVDIQIVQGLIHHCIANSWDISQKDAKQKVRGKSSHSMAFISCQMAKVSQIGLLQVSFNGNSAAWWDDRAWPCAAFAELSSWTLQKRWQIIRLSSNCNCHQSGLIASALGSPTPLLVRIGYLAGNSWWTCLLGDCCWQSMNKKTIVHCHHVSQQEVVCAPPA